MYNPWSPSLPSSPSFGRRHHSSRKYFFMAVGAVGYMLLRLVFDMRLEIAKPVLAATRAVLDVSYLRMTIHDRDLAIFQPVSGAATGLVTAEELLRRAKATGNPYGGALDALLEQGESTYDRNVKRQIAIHTAEKAAEDYRGAFGLPPPEGLAGWWNFSRNSGSNTAPSLIPQAHLPFLPYMAMPTDLLRERVMRESEQKRMFYIELTDNGRGGCDVEVFRNTTSDQGGWWGWMFEEIDQLVRPIAHLIPPPAPGDVPIRMVFHLWPIGRGPMSHTIRDLATSATREGRVLHNFDEVEKASQSKHLNGFRLSCPPDSALGQREVGSPLTLLSRGDYNYDETKTFVSNPVAYSDYCNNPELARLTGLLLTPTDTALAVPVIANARLATSGDIVWPPSGQGVDGFEDGNEPRPWSEKKDYLYWRGRSNNAPDLNRPDRAWRAAQRHRLHYLAHNTTGERSLLVDTPSQTRFSRPPQVAEEQTWQVQDLVKEYLNISLSGEPMATIDSEKKVMAAEINYDRVSPHKQGEEYKYTLEVDGHARVARLRRELGLGSPILKATVHTEWWSHLMVPWYHYIPIKTDYSDLFDVMAYFKGPPAEIKSPKAVYRDHKAQQIGERGRQFAIENWRHVDMQSFTLLMALEYRRIWSLGRV